MLYHVNTNIAQVIKILRVRQPIFIIPKMYFEKKTISYQTPRLYCQIDITTQTYFHSPL